MRDLEGFQPERPVLEEINTVGRETLHMFADAEQDQRRDTVLRFLRETGMATKEVNLGELEDVNGAFAAEAIPAMQGAFKHLSVMKGGGDALVAEFAGDERQNQATLEDACSLLGYSCMIGTFHAQMQLQTAPHRYPILLWGTRGTLQMSGLAMQRVRSRQANDPDAFAAGQQQLVLASNLAVDYLGRFQELREWFKPVRNPRPRPPRTSE